MWGYKLVTSGGSTICYDSDELTLAMIDRNKYGGVIYDRNGKEII